MCQRQKRGWSRANSPSEFCCSTQLSNIKPQAVSFTMARSPLDLVVGIDFGMTGEYTVGREDLTHAVVLTETRDGCKLCEAREHSGSEHHPLGCRQT